MFWVEVTNFYAIIILIFLYAKKQPIRLFFCIEEILIYVISIYLLWSEKGIEPLIPSSAEVTFYYATKNKRKKTFYTGVSTNFTTRSIFFLGEGKVGFEPTTSSLSAK